MEETRGFGEKDMDERRGESFKLKKKIEIGIGIDICLILY